MPRPPYLSYDSCLGLLQRFFIASQELYSGILFLNPPCLKFPQELEQNTWPRIFRRLLHVAPAAPKRSKCFPQVLQTNSVCAIRIKEVFQDPYQFTRDRVFSLP